MALWCMFNNKQKPLQQSSHFTGSNQQKLLKCVYDYKTGLTILLVQVVV